MLRRSRSFKVIEVGTNRNPVCDFLLVINSNWHLISSLNRVYIPWSAVIRLLSALRDSSLSVNTSQPLICLSSHDPLSGFVLVIHCYSSAGYKCHDLLTYFKLKLKKTCQLRCIVTWGHLTSRQSFWALITRSIFYNAPTTNSTQFCNFFGPIIH